MERGWLFHCCPKTGSGILYNLVHELNLVPRLSRNANMYLHACTTSLFAFQSCGSLGTRLHGLGCVIEKSVPNQPRFPGLPHSNLRLYSQYNIIDNKCDNLVLEYNSATCSTNSLLLKNCVSLLVFV